MLVTIISGGQLADLLLSKGILSTTAARKLFTTMGFVFPAGCLVFVAYTTDKQLATAGLIMAVGISGF